MAGLAINRWTFPVVLVLASLASTALWWFPKSLVSIAALTLPIPFLFFFWQRLYAHSPAHLAQVQAQKLNVLERNNQQLGESLRSLGAERAAQQISMLNEKYSDLVNLLNKRFKSSEVTHMRYSQAAEQVRDTALQNLHQIEAALSSVKSIDRNRLLSQLQELNPEGKNTSGEITALETRLSLLGEQETKVENLVAENETALTTLSNTATALADINTSDKDLTAEQAIAELERLAGRAARYDKTRS